MDMSQTLVNGNTVVSMNGRGVGLIKFKKVGKNLEGVDGENDLYCHVRFAARDLHTSLRSQ